MFLAVVMFLSPQDLLILKRTSKENHYRKEYELYAKHLEPKCGIKRCDCCSAKPAVSPAAHALYPAKPAVADLRHWAVCGMCHFRLLCPGFMTKAVRGKALYLRGGKRKGTMVVPICTQCEESLEHSLPSCTTPPQSNSLRRFCLEMMKSLKPLIRGVVDFEGLADNTRRRMINLWLHPDKHVGYGEYWHQFYVTYQKVEQIYVANDDTIEALHEGMEMMILAMQKCFKSRCALWYAMLALCFNLE
jgi:hypothetical protein